MESITITREIENPHSICCPPLMELIEGIMTAKVGDVIAVTADDADSKETIPIWISKAGEELVATEENGNVTRFVVRKTH
jgi:TusA-related sulfurtransferase